MIKKLQKKYALSEQGAKDLIKGCLACVLQNLSFMFPVGLLYYLVGDLMNGGVPGGKIPFYVAGCVVCIGLILLTTFFQYNATYFATYKESGIRRITLAEHLRKIPLSFFGKKDLADLTSTIMADCTFLEQSFSHFIPELDHFYGSDFCRSALYGLENGTGCLMGSAGCLCDCGIFRKDSGKSESESDGCEDGLRRRDTGVH